LDYDAGRTGLAIVCAIFLVRGLYYVNAWVGTVGAVITGLVVIAIAIGPWLRDRRGRGSTHE
jgi:hypothetical protein